MRSHAVVLATVISTAALMAGCRSDTRKTDPPAHDAVTTPGSPAASATASEAQGSAAHADPRTPDHGHAAAAAPAGPVHPGTAAMAARLEALNAALPYDDDLWGNIRRASALEGRPVPAELQPRLQQQLQLGVELLNAGDPEAAAAELGAVRDVLQQGQNLTDSEDLREITSMLAVSWLRLGEIENCAVNHNADSCLLPLADGGIHQEPRGAERAIAELETLMRAHPDNLRDRWVLNIAYMARGTWPDGVRPEWLVPPDVFASDEPFTRFYDIAPSLGLDVADQAGGTIVDDFTGDGNLDVVASSMGRFDQIRFFASRGDGTFEERTAAAGLTGLFGGLNLVQADYDGDGWLDFLILRGGWTDIATPYPSSLVRNRGDGTFEDVTEAAGVLSFHPTQTAAWGDYDNDGDLDLFIGNESVDPRRVHPSQLFQNQGDGTFVDVAEAAGVAAPGFAKSAVWGDYDNDGRLDLFVSRLSQPNVLYRNEGPAADGTWRFTDRATEAGVTTPAFSFPALWWDFDEDGWLDLLVSGYGGLGSDVAAAVLSDLLGLETPAHRVHLYRNDRDGTFTNVAAAAGIADVIYTMGTNVGDLDNDGWEDWYAGTGNPDFRSLLPNRMFRNAGDGTFRDVTTAGGFGHLQKGHGVSFADLDNDGDQDIYHGLGGAYDGDWYPNVLFENPGHGNGWVTLRLRGPGANPAAIGARVTLRLATPDGPRQLHRVVGSGGSFGGNSLQVEVGLGAATDVEGVTVRWPGSDADESFGGVEPGAIWALEAGTGSARRVEQPAFRLGGS